MRRQGGERAALQAIGPDGCELAAARGGAMRLDAAVEYARLVTDLEARSGEPGLPRLTARERELIRLVASGRTDAEIARQLVISIRTVWSHLDRIRAKTGCRRRADLTRLALQIGVI
jgi:DNA-binding CsgD family transcriptional regulator